MDAAARKEMHRARERERDGGASWNKHDIKVK